MTRTFKTMACFQLSAALLPYMLTSFYFALLVSTTWLSRDLSYDILWVPVVGAIAYGMFWLERMLIRNGIKRCRGIPEFALNLSILMCWLGFMIQRQ